MRNMLSRIETNGVRVVIRDHEGEKFSLVIDLLTRRDDNSVGAITYVFECENNPDGSCDVAIVDTQNDETIDANTYDGEVFETVRAKEAHA